MQRRYGPRFRVLAQVPPACRISSGYGAQNQIERDPGATHPKSLMKIAQGRRPNEAAIRLLLDSTLEEGCNIDGTHQ
jgi:hypothetical protein